MRGTSRLTRLSANTPDVLSDRLADSWSAAWWPTCRRTAASRDAGKRTRGRKRHLLVDTGGLLPKAVVHSASVQERAGAKLVLAGITEAFPVLGLVWADAGYVNRVDAGLLAWGRTHTATCRSWHVTPT